MDSSIYLTTKFKYDGNPLIISDEFIHPHVRNMQYRGGNIQVLNFLPFETFGWHPNYINKLAIGDRGTIVDFITYNLIPAYKNGTQDHPRGYYRADLGIYGGKELVHRLVATVFVPNPNLYHTVNFKDRIHYHHYAWNLEWVSELFSSDQKIEILQAINNGDSIQDIYNRGYYSGTLDSFRPIISRVKNDISKWAEEKRLLGLEGMQLRETSYTTEHRNEVQKLLLCLKENHNSKAKEIANLLGVEFKPSFANHITDIRKGKRYRKEMEELGLTLYDINKY